jgi:NAD(P)-dependent dehydrogenase (short-subunit alcohol dehydrogenase family)
MNKIDIKGRHVLVTGASTGIGRAISESLASQGMHVLACARKEADLDALNALPNITAVRMDVTHAQDIKAAAQSIAYQGLRLYAIINNAGIAVGGPMLILPESELRDCLEVNTIAPVNVIRELFPYMEEDGCIINMSSMGARYVTPWMAPYHMSKFAMEAYTDSLRMELAPFGIRVVLIEPGAIKTETLGTKEDRFLQYMRNTIYAEAFQQYWDLISEQHQHAVSPEKVTQVVLDVLRDPKPKKRYLIPHRQIVRLVILLAKFGWSDVIYARFLKGVKKVPPAYFLDHQ